LNLPKKNPLLTYAIQENKKHVVDLLLKQRDIDINIMDSSYMTPLLLAVYNNMHNVVKKLLAKDVNINYVGTDGDTNPMSLIIARNDNNMLDIFFENGFNLNQYNKYMDTPIHQAFSINEKLSPNMVAKLLYYGDMNIQNIEGDTPLHLFLKKYNWKNYNMILGKKKLDIFIKNKSGDIPLNYIKNRDTAKFINFIADNYIDKLRSDKISVNKKQFNGKCNNNMLQTEKCYQEVKNHIMSTKKSYPSVDDEIDMDNKFKMIKGQFSNHGKFNANTLHNMIYTIIMLKKYKNLCIPSQKYIKDKVINDKLLQYSNDLFRSPSEMIITDLVKMYSDYFYEIIPYLIIWRSSNQYYINEHLDYYLQRCLYSNSTRFIFFKITQVASSSGTHANVVIFDKETGVMDRFEPYGVIPHLESNKLDKLIEKKLGSIIKSYLKKEKKNIKFKYLAPKDYIRGVGYQTISNDAETAVKKLGDPHGYCLAWTYWYLEMRLNNPDLTPGEVIDKANSSIIQKAKTTDLSNSLFIDFIRDYAGELDKSKNKYLMDLGISEKYIYNIIMPNKDQDKLVEGLSKDFSKIIKKY
jgi:ankyrin repeat protein